MPTSVGGKGDADDEATAASLEQSTSRQLGLIAEIAAVAGRLGVPCWLRGGWAMDFFLGGVTRPHADIDFLVRSSDAEALADELARSGYVPLPGPPPDAQLNFSKLEEEISFVLVIDEGDGSVLVAGGPHAGEPWPSGMLQGPFGRIGDVAVRVISAAAQIECKEMTPVWIPGRSRRPKDLLDAAVTRNFRSAGARCVVVSGVVDAANSVYDDDEFAHADLTVTRLRIDRHELRKRLLSRGLPTDQLERALAEADAMDSSSLADAVVDASGLCVSEVMSLVREHDGGWPQLVDLSLSAADRARGSRVMAADGAVLWLCGTTGVGKSAVGWEVFQRLRHAGLAAAFVDLAQVGFCEPTSADDPGNHWVKASNLAAMWQTYRAAGAEYLVVVGPAEDSAAVKIYTDALPAATFMLCRLHAGGDELTRRILLRGEGASWSAAGDALKGQSASHLFQVASDAEALADALHRAEVGDLCIDTDRRSVAQVADSILSRLYSWPKLRHYRDASSPPNAGSWIDW